MRSNPERVIRRRLLVLALGLASLPMQAHADPLPAGLATMAGSSLGLLSIGFPVEAGDVSVAVAFVGDATMVDGAPAEGPVAWIVAEGPNGEVVQDRRVLPESAFSRLGSSWYLSIVLPFAGAVSFRLEETQPYTLPLGAASTCCMPALSTGADGIGVRVDNRYEALFIGPSAMASVQGEHQGAHWPMSRTFAYVGDQGTITAMPGLLCIESPSGGACSSL